MHEVEAEVTPPKGFAIFFPAQEDGTSARKKEVTVPELKNFPSSWKVKNLDKVTGGKLRLLREDGEVREFEVVIDYGRRVGSTRVKASSKFKVFQRRGGYAIAIDCPSRFIDTAAALLSLSVHGDLGGFGVRGIKRDDFLKLWEYARTRRGEPRDVHFRMIKGDSVSVYRVSGRAILHVKEIGEPVALMKLAKRIKRLGFGFPPNSLSDSEFHFWIADWGGGTIYEPLQVLPHHAIALAKFFEEALSS